MKKRRQTRKPRIINYHFCHLPIKHSEADLLLGRIKNLTTLYNEKFMAARNFVFHPFEVELENGDRIRLDISFNLAISKLESTLRMTQGERFRFIQNKINIIQQMNKIDLSSDSYFYFNWRKIWGKVEIFS